MLNREAPHSTLFPYTTLFRSAGTYTWSAVYSGDGNNASAADQGGEEEQTVVSPASPNLVTTASGAVTLGSRSEEHTAELQPHSDLVCRRPLAITMTGPGGFSY